MNSMKLVVVALMAVCSMAANAINFDMLEERPRAQPYSADKKLHTLQEDKREIERQALLQAQKHAADRMRQMCACPQGRGNCVRSPWIPAEALPSMQSKQNAFERDWLLTMDSICQNWLSDPSLTKALDADRSAQRFMERKLNQFWNWVRAAKAEEREEEKRLAAEERRAKRLAKKAKEEEEEKAERQKEDEERANRVASGSGSGSNASPERDSRNWVTVYHAQSYGYCGTGSAPPGGEPAGSNIRSLYTSSAHGVNPSPWGVGLSYKVCASRVPETLAKSLVNAGSHHYSEDMAMRAEAESFNAKRSDRENELFRYFPSKEEAVSWFNANVNRNQREYECSQLGPNWRLATVRVNGREVDRCTEYGPVQPEALAFCTLKKEVGWNCDGPVQRMATRERELYDALKMVGCENGFRSMGYDTAHVACRFGLREGDRDLRQRSDVKFSPWNYYQCPLNWSGKCTTVQGKKHNYIRPGS